MARCLRFRLDQTGTRPGGAAPIQVRELKDAFLRCVRHTQETAFQEEIHSLREGRTVKKGSRIARLNPFLDKEGTLRVGGRLQESRLPFDEQHPPILTEHCHLAHLIVDWAHRTSLHGGFAVTHAYTLKRAWILHGRQKTKAVIRKCMNCAKARGRTMDQIVGALPAERIEPSRPFSRVGLDYAGPFQVKASPGRGRRSFKGFIALFVCLSSKAVHLELVGNLTTDSFLGALRRFSSRRGPPAEIWSDNATTFHGANRELKNLLRDSELQWGVVEGTLAIEGIQWRFIPPGAPHFGGLWEAAVKSAKTHLKRIVGLQTLTFEEFSTLLAEIEFVMNSRPLTPLSGEPCDLEVITPWHLVTGSALRTIPEPTSKNNLHHLAHWSLMWGLRDTFWRRWSREYLNTLQQRNKWTRPTPNLQVDDLVLIIDPSLLCRRRWPMGRVTEVHPGRDGRVRVASIKTPTGTYTRPITKLCKLPTS